MKVVELVKISKDVLKMGSKSDLRVKDWQHLEMYEEYCLMRTASEKFRYVIAYLAEKYRVSESTVKRVVRRFSKEVTD